MTPTTSPPSELGAAHGSPARAKRLPTSAFKPNSCAQSNLVFLWEACDQPPFVRPVNGWAIVGYGKAPWFKEGWPVALMFERVSPPTSQFGNSHGDEMSEGTRIWQHGKEDWVPGTAAYNRWMRLENS